MPDLLIEIGVEEIPASYIAPALFEIGEALHSGLAEAGLTVESPTLLATPRRLVLHFAGLPEATETSTEERVGPAAKIAFDGDGKPTKAGLGFARGQGVDPEDLRVVETDKGARVAATVTIPGLPTAEVVAGLLPAALRSAPFPKTMRWTGSEIPFARPIRNLVVLLGEEVVPVAIAGVPAGRATPGHPFLAPEPLDVASADLEAFVGLLREARVMVDHAERREAILSQLAEHGLSDPHEGLLDEVTFLAEWPRVIEGAIDPAFLELPFEVLETAMRVHLRFFPVTDAKGRPEPRFLAVTNREEGSADVVRGGNEKVLASRLYDARFFLGEDRRRSLEDFVPELENKELHRKLGSYRDKADRIAVLAEHVAASAWPDEDLAGKVRRASLLAKADLVTEMVGEFPELQGTVGRIYAALDGEDPDVAAAIEDHYRPRGPNDRLPGGAVSIAVALAEKLDDLASFLAAVGPPSGSSDPFGLRRQTLGLIRITRHLEISFSLKAAFAVASGPYDELMAYLGERLYQFWIDEGLRYDLVRATLAAGFDDLADFHARVAAVTAASENEWWPRLVEVAERTTNILKGAEVAADVDESLLEEKEEHELLKALRDHEDAVAELLDRGDYVKGAKAFADAFGEVVHRFFESVFVNVDDEALRANRLALLGRVNALFASRVADLSDVDRGGEAASG
ncbi:MAG: glycine--tRNA ligase subunit beta [Planctomycetota bacterium]|jgi:glycyl-tRNA synthetase beta chain